jgi:vacuolar-type H+-ATPase subunit H
MSGLSDLLDSGAAPDPGGPGAAPVRDMESVFAAVAAVERECAQVRDTASAAARRCVAQAQREAAALIRAAREDAPAERVRTATRLRGQAGEELADIGTRAEEEAHAVRVRAQARLPLLVEAAMAHVRLQLSALVGEDVVAGLRPPGADEDPGADR